MSRVAVKIIPRNNYAYKWNTINYVANTEKCSGGYIGATNLMLDKVRAKNSKLVREQMEEARDFYNQNDTRLGIHVIFTFSEEESLYLTKAGALKIAYNIAEKEFSGCMTYFSVHDHSGLIHIDMLVDPLNVYTGKMYGCQSSGWWAIANHLSDQLRQYVPEEFISKPQVTYPKNIL